MTEWSWGSRDPEKYAEVPGLGKSMPKASASLLRKPASPTPENADAYAEVPGLGKSMPKAPASLLRKPASPTSYATAYAEVPGLGKRLRPGLWGGSSSLEARGGDPQPSGGSKMAPDDAALRLMLNARSA